MCDNINIVNFEIYLSEEAKKLALKVIEKVEKYIKNKSISSAWQLHGLTLRCVDDLEKELMSNKYLMTFLIPSNSFKREGIRFHQEANMKLVEICHETLKEKYPLLDIDSLYEGNDFDFDKVFETLFNNTEK